MCIVMFEQATCRKHAFDGSSCGGVCALAYLSRREECHPEFHICMVCTRSCAIDAATIAIKANQHAQHVFAWDVFQSDAIIAADHIAFFGTAFVMSHNAVQHVFFPAAIIASRRIGAARLWLALPSSRRGGCEASATWKYPLGAPCRSPRSPKLLRLRVVFLPQRICLFCSS